MAEPSPVVARWELSRRLAARRKELGVDVKTITDALGFTRNYWSAVENDRTLIAEDKLRLLFDVLDFHKTECSELLQLREDSRKRGWWDEYPFLSDEHKRFYGMEAGAERVRTYSGHLIPGILQIDAYARAVFASDPGFSAVDVDGLATVRRRRQDEVFRASSPKLYVLISEAVLWQQVSDIDTQIAQLRQMCELAQGLETRTVLRVLPFDSNPGSIINSATLSFLEYGGSHLPTTAWQEGVQLLGNIPADDERFRHMHYSWEEATRRSLDPESSLELLVKVSSILDGRR